MSIQLTVSTRAFFDQDLLAVLAQTQAIGFEAVELVSHFGLRSEAMMADLRRYDLAVVREQLQTLKLSPISLATNIHLTASPETGQPGGIAWVQQAAQLAERLKIPALRVEIGAVSKREHPRAILERVARQVQDIADEAASRGVQLLFENTPTLPTAKDWWWLMDVVRHPMVGLVWNPSTALAAGESYHVSLPTLGNRIRLVRIDLSQCPRNGDVTTKSQAPPVGQPPLDLAKMLHRLMGLGYGGGVVLDDGRLGQPQEVSARRDALQQAYQQMNPWLKPAEVATTKPEKKAEAKPSAKRELAKASPS